MNRKKELKKLVSELVEQISPDLLQIEVCFGLPDWTASKEAEEVYVFEDLSKWDGLSNYCDHPWGPSVILLVHVPEDGCADFNKAIDDLKTKLGDFLAEKWNRMLDIKQERRDQMEAYLEGRSLERLRGPDDPKIDDL